MLKDYIKNREKKLRNFELSITDVPFPKSALIELTSNCNHACVFCNNPRMKRKSSKLDKHFFSEFILEASKLGLEEVGFYTTGEPLMRKDLIDFVSLSKSAGINYIYITTNGALAKIETLTSLIQAGLSSVKFSINAGTRESYKMIHGKDDFEKVIKNLKNLRSYVDSNGLDVKILSSFVVTKQTIDEVEVYKNLVGPLVDDYSLVGVTGQSGQSLTQLSLLECEMSPDFPKLGEAKPCGMLWNRLHLTQEGYLNLCCVDYENELVYADLKKEKLSDAWNNSVISAMRERHLKQDLKGTLCHNCLYGEKQSIKPILDVEKINKKSMQVEKGEKDVKYRIATLSKAKNIIKEK